MELLPSTEISRIAPRMDRLRERLVATYTERSAPDVGRAGSGSTPQRLAAALASLVRVLYSYAAERQAGRRPMEPEALTQLGEDGALLLEDLGRWTRRLGLEDGESEIRELALAFALWIAREGGELRRLEQAVECIAALANGLRDPMSLAQLEDMAAEVLNAAVDTFVGNGRTAGSDAGPWRLLVLNRAIIATRTLDTARMEAAFDDLVRYLPEQAAGFFREGMGQMERIDYPAPVREVMQRYHRDWTVTTLH